MRALTIPLLRVRHFALWAWGGAWAVPIRLANTKSTDYGHFLAGGHMTAASADAVGNRIAQSAERLLLSIRRDEIGDRRLAMLVFLPVLACYLASAHWALSGSDATAAAWPAWSLVHSGTLHLEHLKDLPPNAWFIRGAHGHLVSSRMPGVIFIGLPAQVFFAWTGWDPVTSSVLTAAVVAAAAVSLTTVLLRRCSSAGAALVGGCVLAFGTTLWTVAGTELWTHGPDALWLAAGLVALSAGRTAWSGVLFAPAVSTRPHLIVAIAAIGVFVAWKRRSFRILPALGIPGAVGLAVVIAFNWYQFGTATLSGGVYSYAGHNAIAGTGGGLLASTGDWASMTLAFLVSPLRGVLPYSPVVLLAVIGFRPAWRQLPDWGRGAAVGGVLYLLVQARINGIYSSFGFFGYRLTIEAVVLWSPLIFLCAKELWTRGQRTMVFILSAASVAIELSGAAFGRVIAIPVNADPWRTWLPVEVMKGGGPKVIIVATLVVLLIALLGIRLLRQPVAQRRSATPKGEQTARRHESGEQPQSPMFNRGLRSATDVCSSSSTDS